MKLCSISLCCHLLFLNPTKHKKWPVNILRMRSCRRFKTSLRREHEDTCRWSRFLEEVSYKNSTCSIEKSRVQIVFL